MSAEPKLVDGPRGGKLSRSGRPKGAKTVITKTFETFAKATLNDPEIQALIRKRLVDELNGRKLPPLHTLTVLTAAAVRQKPRQNGGETAFFAVRIVDGRGQVRRLDDAEKRAALPAQLVAGVPKQPS